MLSSQTSNVTNHGFAHLVGSSDYLFWCLSFPVSLYTFVLFSLCGLVMFRFFQLLCIIFELL